MVESVDTPDLKSCDQKWSCRFDPGSGYTAKTFAVLAFFICGLFGYLPLETPNRPADDNGDRSVTTAIRPTFDPGSGYTAKTFEVLAFLFAGSSVTSHSKTQWVTVFSYKESIHKKIRLLWQSVQRVGLLLRFEVLLRGAAQGACPVVGQIFEGRAGRYAVFGVAHLRIIDPAAGLASVLFHRHSKF